MEDSSFFGEIDLSGLLRNLLALIAGFLFYRTKQAEETTTVAFFVSPFDTGIRVLKSDKYLQFAETAQIDYLLRTGTFLAILRAGVSFVNVAQLVKFVGPVPVFSRVRVDTRLIYADERCAFFFHTMHAQGDAVAEVLVKMKFKKGRITVPPRSFLPVAFDAVPARVQALEPALAG